MGSVRHALLARVSCLCVALTGACCFPNIIVNHASTTEYFVVVATHDKDARLFSFTVVGGDGVVHETTVQWSSDSVWHCALTFVQLHHGLVGCQ